MAAVIVLAMAGRAEGQGLPVRVTIAARATVMPLPAAQTVILDSAQVVTGSVVRRAAVDSAAATERRRVRRVVVSYPGT